eukprot:TRINITY_DN8152_c0_g2_i5.p1 TRINITY_DN8152_c0_g2~~TRINITY_DN8152_c0_g2_i5.p1  ORF type:complete len:853 (-),score=109.04 TRINITY_DN8152_c0_g2_i5:68-2626(-)
MGDLWRSEEMQLIQLFIQIEAAHATMDELGKLGLVAFRDLNPHINAFQRNFVNDVKRAEEMLRKLRSFEKQIQQFNIEAELEKFAPIREDQIKDPQTLGSDQLTELENKFEDLEKQLNDLNNHHAALNRSSLQLTELQHVLELAEETRNLKVEDIGEADTPVQGEDGPFQIKFLSVSGVVERSRFNNFENILFRASRGNLYMKYEPIKTPIRDPVTGQLSLKNVFIIFYQGERLGSKIRKICEAYSANLYPCPESSEERTELLDQVNTRIQEFKIILDKGWDQRFQLLSLIAKEISTWSTVIEREKIIYHTMNLFNYDVGRRCLIAEGWCPVKAQDQIQMALRAGRERSGALIPSILNVVPSDETPPTYFETNKFTSSFQSIVNSYGTARYREINPAVFTIVTFPFEFGIMFGDVGHGVILLIVSLLLLLMESRLEGKKVNETIDMLYSGRYLLLLMSLFAVYIGFLYNELFAIPMNFGSRWLVSDYPPYNILVPEKNYSAYPFGVDPVWKGATNELGYYNSLKMKTSVTVGVCQMSLGLVLSLLNNLYFKEYYDIIFVFIPRVVFLSSTFGYLVIMIFMKWNIDWVALGRTHDAPNLLNALIYMFVPSKVAQSELYSGQTSTQKTLRDVAIVCIPWMLFLKPTLLYLDYRSQLLGYASFFNRIFGSRPISEEELDVQSGPVLFPSQSIQIDESAVGGVFMQTNQPTKEIEPVPTDEHLPGHRVVEFDIGEIMVHEGLETIEFVLGCVSHTASYLRLWALSLAHSELATVFWEKAFFTLWTVVGFKSIGGLGAVTFVFFSIWFGASVLVIVGMESLSAFLHALRLHWVEFQSKFYHGDGYPFVPFSYRQADA